MINDDNQDVDFENNEEEVVEVEEEESTEEAPNREAELEAENKKLKAILERNKNKKTDEKPASKKSDGFGYDVKAYLKASGIKADEFDFVQKEFKQSGLTDVDALLENDYFQARLEKQRALNATANAAPSSKRSGGVAVDSVEYWMAKPLEEVPSDMRIKVVNAMLEKDKVKGVFYNS